MKIILYSILFFISVTVNAQTSDSTVKLKAGIFLTIDDYASHNPISPGRIIEMKEDKSRKHFHELMERKKITISAIDSTYQLKLNTIWGYSDGKHLFVSKLVFAYFGDALSKRQKGNFKATSTEFIQALLVGRICLFNIEKVREKDLATMPDVINPDGTVTPGRSIISKKVSNFKDYLLKVNNGKKKEVNFSTTRTMFADDEQLLDEFNLKINERRWEKAEEKTIIYRFIQKYNERNPL